MKKKNRSNDEQGSKSSLPRRNKTGRRPITNLRMNQLVRAANRTGRIRTITSLDAWAHSNINLPTNRTSKGAPKPTPKNRQAAEPLKIVSPRAKNNPPRSKGKGRNPK